MTMTWRKLRNFCVDRQELIVRLLLVLFFFIVPALKGIPLSGIPLNILRLDIVPPGYPVPGDLWHIKVWGSVNSIDWHEVSNCTVVLITEIGNYEHHTDDQGSLDIRYLSDYGRVTIRAFKEGYDLPKDWIPVERFIGNQTARLFITLYGLGLPTSTWQTVKHYRKQRRKLDYVGKGFLAMLLLTGVLGWTLSFIWLIDWKYGTSFGYSNSIVAGLSYDPHLLLNSAAFVALSVASAIWTYFGIHGDTVGGK